MRLQADLTRRVIASREQIVLAMAVVLFCMFSVAPGVAPCGLLFTLAVTCICKKQYPLSKKANESGGYR
jgi:hypothetical protein